MSGCILLSTSETLICPPTPPILLLSPAPAAKTVFHQSSSLMKIWEIRGALRPPKVSMSRSYTLYDALRNCSNRQLGHPSQLFKWQEASQSIATLTVIADDRELSSKKMTCEHFHGDKIGNPVMDQMLHIYNVALAGSLIRWNSLHSYSLQLCSHNNKM